MTAPLHVVVGTSGQIGTHLVRALESAGHRVRAVTRTARRGHVCGDISDVTTAIELCAEMAFQWDRPYLVSHAKIAGRYGLEPTAIDDGLRPTADALATARRK